MTHTAEKDACGCDPDDPCFCFPELAHPEPRYAIRPSPEFVQQARALGALRYPLRVISPEVRD